ncbi:MAG: GNAT family N-acetyltransferase [Dehalococcoidia bacterium]|nr:GNAT family N-acetyltransferase [Dehalococcoidia bacterium]
MEIRSIRADEGLRVRNFRLRALGSDPDAFASTLQEEQAILESEWRSRAERVAKGETAATFVADHEGAWMGMVFVFREPRAPDVVDLAGLWVDPLVRGHGTGHHLLDAVMAWAREQKAHTIRLWVTETNTDARNLYKGYGFTETGRHQPLRSNPQLKSLEMTLEMPAGEIGGD